ncbi:thiamine phosphate synthase [Candidatus Woesearchaeota archaeon]|nr:thiamine phosphate synthase [Candidatus Woesearchaeota archaeon]
MKPHAFYLVTESNLSKGRTNAEIVREAIKGGVDIVQLREKEWSKERYREEAKKLRKLCHTHEVLFVVNDYPDIAKEVGADGLHLGQEDMPIAEARKIVGKMKIGKSTHSGEQALNAVKEGADYISIGPIFPTRKKPNPVGVGLIRALAPVLKIPFVAIGGIKLENVDEVLSAGATSIAVISAVVEAEDVRAATAAFAHKIHEVKL